MTDVTIAPTFVEIGNASSLPDTDASDSPEGVEEATPDYVERLAPDGPQGP